ncbi:MAG TPA: hypothetical protein VHG52_07855, partial [Thermomicrobiales bacterium]|nr:hypothetical protein [Thermomicrobiales bacterium]
MTSSLAAERPDVAASPAAFALPEPLANRAQPIPGSMLLRWLSGVVTRDSDGYAVIAGNGRTVTLLYGAGRPLATMVSRGLGDGGLQETLDGLQSDSASGCFVMTYKLPASAGELLSGLFGPPVECRTVRPSRLEVKDLLESVGVAQFRGAALITAEEESIWGVALIDGGEVFGC